MSDIEDDTAVDETTTSTDADPATSEPTEPTSAISAFWSTLRENRKSRKKTKNKARQEDELEEDDEPARALRQPFGYNAYQWENGEMPEKVDGKRNPYKNRTVASDIGETLRMVPSNLWQIIYNPEETDFDSIGRLGSRVLKALYQPYITIPQYIPFRDKLRIKFQNVALMDADSYTYLEPLIEDFDDVILGPLRDLYSKDNLALIDEADSIAQELQAIAKKIHLGEDETTHKDTIAQKIQRLGEIKEALQPAIDALSSAIADVKTKVDDIPVPKQDNGADNELTVRYSRKKALRSFLKEVEKLGTDLTEDTVSLESDLNGLISISSIDRNNFSDELEKISSEYRKKTGDKKARVLGDFVHDRQEMITPGLLNMAYIRKTGRRPDGSLAYNQEIRTLKRSFDLYYVNPHARKLPISLPEGKLTNVENSFIKLIEGALELKRKKAAGESYDKTTYEKEAGRYLANLYESGNEQDALRAMNLLMMAIGADSDSVDLDGVSNHIREALRAAFTKIGVDLQYDPEKADPHFNEWLTQLETVGRNRQHSPRASGPRAAENWYINKFKDFYYGRMYPMPGAYLATPFKQKYMEVPIYRAKKHIIAFVSGRRVVPLSPEERAELKDGDLKKESNVKVVGNIFLWQKRTDEEKEEHAKKNKFQKVLSNVKGLYSRAPAIMRAPLNIVFGSAFMPAYGLLVVAKNIAFKIPTVEPLVKRVIPITAALSVAISGATELSEEIHESNPDNAVAFSPDSFVGQAGEWCSRYNSMLLHAVDFAATPIRWNLSLHETVTSTVLPGGLYGSDFYTPFEHGINGSDLTLSDSWVNTTLNHKVLADRGEDPSAITPGEDGEGFIQGLVNGAKELFHDAADALSGDNEPAQDSIDDWLNENNEPNKQNTTSNPAEQDSIDDWLNENNEPKNPNIAPEQDSIDDWLNNNGPSASASFHDAADMILFANLSQSFAQAGQSHGGYTFTYGQGIPEDGSAGNASGHLGLDELA